MKNKEETKTGYNRLMAREQSFLGNSICHLEMCLLTEVCAGTNQVRPENQQFAEAFLPFGRRSF